MAARSPIVLDSPSPTVSELPPITPQQHRKSSTIATDSSPALLSIRKLVRPPNSDLVSGSRAQEVPQGAKAGFPSAASLWKAQKSEAGTKTAGHQDEDTKVPRETAEDAGIARKNAGKLPKRRKPEETARSTREPSVTAQSPLSAFAYQDDNVRRRSISASPTPVKKSVIKTANLEEPRSPQEPSISLCEYDFRPEDPAAPELPTVPSEPVRKPRKPRVKTDETNAEGAAKKPRKRTAKTTESGEGTKKKSRQPLKKSESTILNSDDLAATQAGTYSRIEIPSPPPKVRKARKPTSRPVTKVQEDDESTTAGTSKATSEKSSYFGGAAEQKDEAALEGVGSTKDVLDLAEFARESTPKSPEPSQVAPRRRLSWTPAKKTETKIVDEAGDAPTFESGDEETTTKSLAELVSGLGYASGSAYIPPIAGQRLASGEALTKRRRIDLADEATKAPTRRKASPGPVPAEKPKKAKAPKKKPQTITDLATKAYRAAEEEDTAQPTVSEFFSAQKADTVPAPETTADDTSVKPKKPRKPRTKKVDGTSSKPESVLKTTKSKKAKKVRIVEDDYPANLHSPSQARAQERNQDFLFGTSSQLGVDDSPTFIRDMQMAVRESEAIPPSRVDNPKSRAIMPRDAHSGAKLSAIKENKDLWCTAARDIDGDVMRLDSATIRIVQARERLMMQGTSRPAGSAPGPPAQADRASDGVPADALHLLEEPQDVETSKITDEPASIGHGRETIEPPPIAPESAADQEIVDLCHTSPLAEVVEVALPTAPELPQVISTPSSRSAIQQTNVPEAEGPQSDEIWAIIPSDSSPREQPAVPSLPVTTTLHSSSKQPEKVIPQLKRSATSPIRQRSALQALDANISSLHHTSPGKGAELLQQRTFAAATAPDLLKRPRGRPKKNTTTDNTPSTSPKKRGRPLKADTLTASPKLHSRKTVGLGISASQPVGSGSSAFANIDEISDSDSPTTPSPPKRRAMSSPPEVRALEFDVVESPSKSKAPRTALLTLKPGDDYFVTTIQPSLFPQITETVRSTPPSTSLTNPSWHEKILLYDPIVLEDFTAWLNEQGLTIELHRLKPKPKTKGRKKKDAPPMPDEPDYEAVKEELKPWMVQKWCEEKSVCCLWKEGLRGGVRTRY